MARCAASAAAHGPLPPAAAAHGPLPATPPHMTRCRPRAAAQRGLAVL